MTADFRFCKWYSNLVYLLLCCLIILNRKKIKTRRLFLLYQIKYSYFSKLLIFRMFNYEQITQETIHVCLFSPYSQKVQMKLQVADVFLDKFQLKPDEVKALRGNRDGSLSQVSNQLFYWVCYMYRSVYTLQSLTLAFVIFTSVCVQPLYIKILT